jgi:hypothetical protein
VGNPKITEDDIIAHRNRLCQPLQYRLWHDGEKTKAAVQLLRLVKGRQEKLLRRNEIKYPNGYAIWVVEVMGGDLPQDVSVAFLGKTLTDMEALALASQE